MNKVLLAGFIIFFVIACSDKKEELKPKKVENNETKVDVNRTKIDTNVTKKNMMVIKEEFIPEHIRNSHIEVVEHY